MSYRDRGGFRNTFSARDQMKRDEGIRITVPNRDHRQAGDYSRQGRDRLPAHEAESIRITVDTSQQRSSQPPTNRGKMSGYEKSKYLSGFAGGERPPPKRKFQESKDMDPRLVSRATSGNDYERRRGSRSSHRRDRDRSSSRSSSSSGSPDSRRSRSRSSSPDNKPRDVNDLNLKGMPVSKAKDLILSHFPDLFDSFEGNLFKKDDSAENSQDATSLKMLPASTLPEEIDDEDAFLYGEEEEKKAPPPPEPAPSRRRRSPTPKHHTGLSALQQNYNKEALRKSRHKKSRHRERSASPERAPLPPPLPPPQEEAPPPPLPPPEEKKNLIKDPTIESILKSIGFNFELSQQMQREADQAKASTQYTAPQVKEEKPKTPPPPLNPENPYVEKARKYREEEQAAAMSPPPEEPSFSANDKFNYENREFEAMHGESQPPHVPPPSSSMHPTMMPAGPPLPATNIPHPNVLPPGYAGGPPSGYMGPPPPGYSGPPPPGYAGPPPGYGGPPPGYAGPPPGYGGPPPGFGGPPPGFGGPPGPPYMGPPHESRSRSRSPPGIWLDDGGRQSRSHHSHSRSPPRHRDRRDRRRDDRRDSREKREFRDNRDKYDRDGRDRYDRDGRDGRNDKDRRERDGRDRRSDRDRRDDKDEGSSKIWEDHKGRSPMDTKTGWDKRDRSNSRDPRDKYDKRDSLDKKRACDWEGEKKAPEATPPHRQHSRSSSRSKDQQVTPRRGFMQPPADDNDDRKYMSPINEPEKLPFPSDYSRDKRSASPTSVASSQRNEEPPHKRKVVVKPQEEPSIAQQKSELLDKLVTEDTKLAKCIADRDYQDTQIRVLQKKLNLDSKPNPHTYELLRGFEERRETVSREIVVLRTRQDSLKRKIDTLERQEKQNKYESKVQAAPEAKKEEEKKEVKKPKLKKMTVNYDYFDSGSHWCKLCNAISTNIHDFLFHLSSKKHQQKLDPYDRPWLPDTSKQSKAIPTHAVATPVQGVEFMMTTQAYYCTLCKTFSGDNMCAELHLKSDEHNETYRRYTEDNPGYVRRYTLEKAAGLSRVRSAEDPESKAAEVAEEEEQRMREDAEDYAREKTRIQELRRVQQEEERETREKKRQEFEKKLAEKRRKYESEPSHEEEMEEERDEEKPLTPAVTRRPTLLIGKMPGRKKKEEKKEEEDDKRGISIKLAPNKNTTKKTSVLNILESKKESSSGKPPALSKAALLERSQALIDAVKKRKIEEEQKSAEQQAPLDYEANIDSFVRTEEEKARKSKQALEEAARQESAAPENIPLPPPPPEEDPAKKEEEEDMAMLGIDKPDTSADKVKAPPPVSVATTMESPTSGAPAAATASAARLGSIFYGAKEPEDKPAQPTQTEKAEEEEEETLEEECAFGSDVEMLDECDEA